MRWGFALFKTASIRFMSSSIHQAGHLCLGAILYGDAVLPEAAAALESYGLETLSRSNQRNPVIRGRKLEHRDVGSGLNLGSNQGLNNSWLSYSIDSV